MATEKRKRRRDNDESEVEDFIIDFSKEVKGAGGGIRIPEGTYSVRILAAKPVVSGEKETPGLQVTFQILDGKKKGTKLNDTLWATPKAYGRFRTLLEACGKKVPAKVNLVRIAQAIKGCELYIEVQDESREGYKTRSRVTFEGFINPDDYDPDDEDDVDEDDDIDEDDDDDDDEDDEDEEDDDPPPARRRRKAEPAKASKKSKRKARDDDDDEDLDDDLDLDEL